MIKRFYRAIMEILETLQRMEKLMRYRKESISPLEKTFLSTEEAGEYLSISENAMKTLVKDKAFPVYRPGRNYTYVKRSDLDEYILKFKVRSADEILAEAARMRSSSSHK